MKSKKYIIQPFTFEITGTGTVENTFKTYNKYTILEGFALLAFSQDLMKRNKFGLKINKRQIFENGTSLHLINPSDSYKGSVDLKNRFVPLMESIDNSEIVINYEDTGAAAALGSYDVCLYLLLSVNL